MEAKDYITIIAQLSNELEKKQREVEIDNVIIERLRKEIKKAEETKK